MNKLKLSAILVLLCAVVFSAGCTKEVNYEENEKIIKAYVADFLSFYSQYYEIKEIETVVNEAKAEDQSYTAYISVKMTYKNFTPDSVEEVGYIKEAREKAEMETDPQLKEMYQRQYQTLRDEYLLEQESNFDFKAEGQLKEGLLEKDSISLFLAQDGEAGKAVYVPAEGLKDIN